MTTHEHAIWFEQAKSTRFERINIQLGPRGRKLMLVAGALLIPVAGFAASWVGASLAISADLTAASEPFSVEITSINATLQDVTDVSPTGPPTFAVNSFDALSADFSLGEVSPNDVFSAQVYVSSGANPEGITLCPIDAPAGILAAGSVDLGPDGLLVGDSLAASTPADFKIRWTMDGSLDPDEVIPSEVYTVTFVGDSNYPGDCP